MKPLSRLIYSCFRFCCFSCLFFKYNAVIAYAFVPDADANYSTVRVGRYVGLNNAAWIGHITAIMASAFLWLIGFYIINNGIRRDKETGVGQIISTTSITNYQYLLAKSLSNFLVLLSLLGIIILVALVLIVSRGGAYEFNMGQFILPYFFTTIPSLFYLSVLTVVLEVVFGKRTNLLNVVFFFAFGAIISMTNSSTSSSLSWLDPLGIKFLTNEISTFVSTLSSDSNLGVNVGFNFFKAIKFKYFLFTGSNISATYLFSRLVWVLIAFVLLKVTAKSFNRFDTESIEPNKSKKDFFTTDNQSSIGELKAGALVKTEAHFGIFPLFKAEFLLLIRKGPKWFWMINLGVLIALLMMPLDSALKIGLPILWFLQINRWADLSTKEIYFGTDKFIYSTYKPLQRMLTSQILAGIALAVLLALPVILRLIFNSEIIVACEVVLGAIILVSFSVCSGIVWGGKRFFEIVLFMTTYFAIQGLNFLDYWGGNHSSINYIIVQISICIAFLLIAFSSRQYIIKKQ